MGFGFKADEKIQRIAEAYTLDMVEFAQMNYRIELNLTESSIQHIEAIAANLHDWLPTSNPSENQIFLFAKMLGSYVGEVFRLTHGATWGIVAMDDQDFPGMQCHHTKAVFWPWGRAQNRIVDGPENNIWHYYLSLIPDEVHGTEPMK